MKLVRYTYPFNNRLKKAEHNPFEFRLYKIFSKIIIIIKKLKWV